MAGYKETPRQKLIAMMYLVLTALLALNVSKDILEAFLVVNESMQTTNENFVKKVEGSYASFEKALAENPNKVQKYYDKAMIAKNMSTDLVKFLEDAKAELIARSDKIPIEEARMLDLRKVKTRDKWDFATHYFIGDSQDGSKGKAREIKNNINEYKKQVTNLVDTKYRHMLKIGLNTEDVDNKIQGTKNWEMYNFYHTILAADVVILNKLIAEVKNAEFDVVSQLYAEVSIEDFKFDEIAAKVIPKSNYVLVGEDYEAEIFVAAYNTKDNPDVQIVLGADTATIENLRNAKPIEGDKGIVIYKQAALAEGTQKYAGVINVRTPGGGIKSYAFKNEYVVARPSAIVSAEKMNVFYIGVDNPVSISVPGVPTEKIRSSIVGGKLTPIRGKKGKYNVRVKSGGGNKAIIKVSADFNGQLRSMGSSEFRIKRVPDPIPYIAGQNEGPVSKAAILAAGGIIPRMENFDFDLNFIVTSFSMVTNVRGDLIEKSAQGNRLTQEMGSILNRAVRGQKVWFEEIRAKGPDGTIRKLPAIAVKIM